MDMLLHQKCALGASCPRHHVSGHVCLDFQTKGGCRKNKCQFKHEVIGPVAAKALMNHCKQKAAQNQNKASPSNKSGGNGGKAPAGKKAAAPKGAPKSPGSNVNTKTIDCKNWHNPASPGTCRFGDNCRFRHDE